MAIPASRLDGRPTCPQGHPGRVIAFGRQVRADEAYSRPRFRCFPSDGSAEHTFMPARRQPTHGHPHGAVCVHCERDYGAADGARTGPRYSQSVVEIGSLLASVARGDSLRLASRDARKAARRLSLGPFHQDGSPRARQAYNSRQNVLAATARTWALVLGGLSLAGSALPLLSGATHPIALVGLAIVGLLYLPLVLNGDWFEN